MGKLMGKLKPGVYETFYGNIAAWDGTTCCDLDMMEIVPIEAITSGGLKLVRNLEREGNDILYS